MIGIGWGKMVDGARDDSIGRRGRGIDGVLGLCRGGTGIYLFVLNLG